SYVKGIVYKFVSFGSKILLIPRQKYYKKAASVVLQTLMQPHHYVYRAPGLDETSQSVTQVHGSAEASPRHTEESTYCCFLPDLTGFMGLCCAGPQRQHQSLKADLRNVPPQT